MKHLRLLALAIMCALLVITVTPAHASIDSMNLGASYNSGKTQVTWQVIVPVSEMQSAGITGAV